MSAVKSWIQAFRLRTLPLAFSCILMGTFLAASDGYFNGWIFSFSLITTLCLQILSNLANDYGDASSGVDGDRRTGPARTVHSGLISAEAMKRALVIFSLLSLLSGCFLLWLAFRTQWMQAASFLVVGIGAIAAAIKYTVGKNPYGYSGFGDLFVLLFFGFVGVGGSYYLYALTFYPALLLPAFSCGLFAVAVLNLNNIRDIESDRLSGKYSLPVRLGRKRAVYYHWILLTTGLLSSVCYTLFYFSQWKSWLFLLVVPLLVINARAVLIKKRSPELDPYLRQMVITTLLFVLLFGLGKL